MTREVLFADQVASLMAYDRKLFKSKLLGILSGAITHFYMVQLARLNRQAKWVDHWQREIDRLVNMDLVVILATEIKGRWDKRKAMAETLIDVQSADHRYRTAAANYVSRVYQLKKVNKRLPEGVEQEFIRMVHASVDRALAPDV